MRGEKNKIVWILAISGLAFGGAALALWLHEGAPPKIELAAPEKSAPAPAAVAEEVRPSVDNGGPKAIKILPKKEAADLEVASLNRDYPPNLEHPEIIDGPEIPPSEEKGVKAMFGFTQLVTAIKTEPDEKGRFLKVEIYNTDFKYPLIRVAEKWSSESEMAGRSAMVADHMIVEWKESAQPEAMAKLLEANNAALRSVDPGANYSLVSFDGMDPRALGKILKSFRESPLVKNAEPDYLATSNPKAFQ